MTRGGGQSVRPLHARDTDATAFTAVLTDLISRIPGAHSAALVDSLGEAVDYTGRVPPFDVKVAGAHYKIVIDDVRSRPPFRDLRTLFVRGSRGSFAVRALPDDYAIVVLLSKRAGFATTRALDVCERALIEEAGLSPRRVSPWTVVAVNCDRRRRPVRVTTLDGATSLRAEVLGAVHGLANRERGFRVRLETGAEVMLVRELGGTWYAEEPIDFAPDTGR
jgi:hypothetical protein